MKKSLIALAVLAASGAAMAQSSVTLYGRVDAALAYITTTVNGNETSVTGIQNGSVAGLTGSRWGLKGTEDLGNGLKANFVLENRFDVDTGTTAGQFLGNSYVSLAGGFGEVKLGRTYTAFDDTRAMAVTHVLWDSAFTPAGGAYAVGGGDYTSRGASQIRYDAPNFSGFTGAASYAFDEETAGNKQIMALSIKYAAGPLAVGYGYQEEETFGTADSKAKFNAVSGLYNFGVAAISAGYTTRDSALKGDDQGFTVGVNVPMGAFQFSAGYAKAENELNGVSQDGEGWGIGAKYALSKRTTLYTGYRNTEVETTAGTGNNESELFSAGVRHDF